MCKQHHDLLKAYQKAVSTLGLALDALEAAQATVQEQEQERLARYLDQAV
jgi:hypothetical protein